MDDSSWTTVDVTDSSSRFSAASDNASSPLDTLLSWLTAAGLEKHSDQILSLTEANAVDDFKLLSTSAVESIIVQCDMKLISAEKFRRAIAILSGNEASAASTVPDVALQEAIAICIDRSFSMGTPFAEVTLERSVGQENAISQRSRMEAVKAMFYAFRDRIDSMRDPSIGQSATHLGLLSFDTQVNRLLGLTADLDQFEAIVDDIEKRGQTAIFSAILDGVKMLEPIFGSRPTADLRVLILSDGESNCGASPQAALAAANSIGAVVDAIIVGDRPDSDLRKIVAATGGMCFQIQSLGEGFELLEGEGVASLRARRGGADKPAFVMRPPVDFATLEAKDLSKAPPSVGGSVSMLQSHREVDLSSRLAAPDVTDFTGAAQSSCIKRLLKEMRQVKLGTSDVWLASGDGVHIFPSESDLTKWRVLIEGPQGSPFAGGIFSLTVRIPSSYPNAAPDIRFETPIYHCGVSDSGQICLDFLLSWAPTKTLPQAIEAVRLMLTSGDTSNAMRQWIAELTIAEAKDPSDTRFSDEAKKRTRKDAAKRIADWQREWAAM